MQLKKIAKRIVILALLLLSLIIVALSIPSVRVYLATNGVGYLADLLITYGYYGDELSAREVYAKWETGDELHCIQIPTEPSYRFHIANRFECFDTIADADTWYEANHERFTELDRKYDGCLTTPVVVDNAVDCEP